MKNVFSILGILLCSFSVFGQTEWVGNHTFSEAATDVVRTSQGQYVLLHGNGRGFTVFNENGAVVAQDTTYYFTSDGYSDLLELPDSSLIFVTGGVDCDVIINYFYKYDKDWNRSEWKYSNGGRVMTRFSDNSIAVSDEVYGYVEKLSPNGDQLWLWDIFSYDMRDLLVIPGDTLLAASNEGVIRVKADGGILDTLSNWVLNRLEILPNGNLLAQVNNVLFLLNTSFSPISFYQVQSETIDDIAIENYEIAVLTSAPSVIRLDHALNTLGTTPLSGHNQTFTSVVYASNGFMLGGSELYGNNGHESTASFIKSYAYDGSTVNTAKDLALTEIGFNGPISVEDQGWMYVATIPPMSMTVKNNGAAPVHRLNINLELPMAVLSECYDNQSISKPYENLNILPGESIVLDWGEQVVYFNDDPSGQELEICVWSSLPDHLLETNNDNDVSCTSALMTGSREPVPFSFSSHFNPVTDMLSLEMPSTHGIAIVNLFNATGQLVQTAQTEGPTGQLDLSGLTDGAYFLQIKPGDKLGWGKFIKY